MGNIHINSNGEPGTCKAQQGGCPFGSSENHFDNAQQAETAYASAQEAMGNTLGKETNAFKGAYAYSETRNDAFKIANIIAHEGKVAVVTKMTTIHLNEAAVPGGIVDADDYDNGYDEEEDEEDDEYAAEKDDFAEQAEDFNFEDDDFNDPDLGEVRGFYMVRSFDNNEDVKKYNQEKDWSENNYKTVEVDMDASTDGKGSEFTSSTDYNPDDFTLMRVNLSIVQPAK